VPFQEARRELNQRDDLKSGWTRIENPDGSFGRRPHWAFTDPAEIESAQSLVEMLRAFRYKAMTEPDGEIYGVKLIGGTRTAGDDVHLWRALAPHVEAGGELTWLCEDDKLQRWSFDGRTMTVADGRMVSPVRLDRRRMHAHAAGCARPCRCQRVQAGDAIPSDP
jgi:hypothetical protein